jgi:DnaK suppressor protein
MNRQRHRSLKQLLLRRKALLLEDLAAIEAESSQDVDYTGFDVAEQGTFDSEKELEFSMLDSKRQQLRKVDEALERLRERHYGNCEICMREIPLKRLKVIPFTELCVLCQEKYEHESGEDDLRYAGSWGRLDAYARDPVNGDNVA